MKSLRLSVFLGCLLVPGSISLAALVDVGDSQTFTLQANANGNLPDRMDWGLPIPITAGSYKYYLEDSYWNFGIFGLHNEVVGGVSFFTAAKKNVLYNPMAYGIDPNKTIRIMYFDIDADQTLYAGVADNVLWDNSGTAVFTLTKLANPSVPDSAPGTVAAALFVLLGCATRFHVRTKIPAA